MVIGSSGVEKKSRKPKTMRTPAPGAALLTLQTASAEYGPPYMTLRDLVLDGHLPRVQLGNSRRIWVRRRDMERLISAEAR